MSLQVSEIDDSGALYRVRWTAEPGHRMRKGEPFHVGCTSQSFVVSCARDGPLRNTQLRLQAVARRPDSANSSTEDSRETRNDAARLVTVWTRGVNAADSKLYLKRHDADTWTLTSRWIDVDEQKGESRCTIAVKLWLKFERPSPAQNALNQLLALFASEKCCDTAVQLSSGETVGAHKVVLAARCPALAERATPGSPALVRVDDVEPRALKHLLHYAYSARHPEPLTVSNARQLFSAADKFRAYDLRDECSNFMLSHIDVDNAVDLLMWARERSAGELERACSAFVVRKGYHVAVHDSYEQLMKKHPDLCLRLTREMLAKTKTEHPAAAAASEVAEEPVDEEDDGMDESDTSESAIESDCLFNYF